jgi:gamma-glutamyl-gamma-aminobutyraldehyde dehydrogenase
VGKLLLGYAGQSNMKRVALETGGKSPQIFLDDLYDLDAAVERAVGGIYDNAGQVCNAGSRLLVQRGIHDEFVKRFIARAQVAYRPGDPLDPATTLGPLVSHAHQRNVLARIARGQSEGAQLALGGAAVMPVAGGAFVEPTLFLGATSQMALTREEVFGPVTAVTAFDTVEDAIALANDSDLGLGGSVWTQDEARGLRMASRIDAGMLFINNLDWTDASLPFGGIKHSGYGRELGRMGIQEFVNWKLVRSGRIVAPV